MESSGLQLVRVPVAWSSQVNEGETRHVGMVSHEGVTCCCSGLASSGTLPLVDPEMSNRWDIGQRATRQKLGQVLHKLMRGGIAGIRYLQNA